MKLKVFLILALGFVTSIHAQDVNNTVKIVTGAGDYFGPWHHLNDEGQLQGYDIAVGNAVCAKAGLKCEFHTQEFASIISSIRFKKYDVIMSGLTNNINRRRVIDFSDAYASSGTYVVTNDAVSDGKDFCKTCPKVIDVENVSNYNQFAAELKKHFEGKTVAVQRGTISHDFFKEQPDLLKFINLKTYETRPDVLEAVAKNEAAIGFGPDWVEDYNKENNAQMRIQGFIMSGGNFGRGVGIGVRKEDAELKAKLSKAIAELKKEGKLKEMAMKWFGSDESPE